MTTVQRDGLWEALLAVQAEAPTLRKDATNPHYQSKYTPLDTIVETIGPLLSKHGLVWTTFPSHNDGAPVLRYTLKHITGESIDGEMPLLLGKADSQSLGSAITYARRYSLCAVLNLVADDDDDGSAAVAPAPRRQMREPEGPATDAQKGAIRSRGRALNVPEQTWRALLDSIGAQGVVIQKGWTDLLTKRQASELLDALNQGTLPDPEAQDIPSDYPDDTAVVGLEDDNLPFDAT